MLKLSPREFPAMHALGLLDAYQTESPENIYRRTACNLSEEVGKTTGVYRVPSKEAQEEYIEAVVRCCSWFWADAVEVRLPLLGGGWLASNEGPSCPPRPGHVRWEIGKYELEFLMPSYEDEVAFAVPRHLQRPLHYPWAIIAIPFLLLALVPATIRRSLFGNDDWRLRRARLRFMWRFRPQTMTRKLHAKAAKERKTLEGLRDWDVERERIDAARKAEREAVFEAEVERRLALRLAAAGA